MPLDTLTAVFGWMSVINILFLAVSALMMLIMKDWAAALHARLFDIDAAAARLVWYRWLGTYKILALITSIVPYAALRLAA